MSNSEQPALSFLGMDIVDLDVVCENVYDKKEEIDTVVIPKVHYPEGQKEEFKILMDVSLSAKKFFKIKLMGVGHFRLNQVIDENMKKTFINVNAPAILFPYCRSFVSTLTSNMGEAIGTLNMPPRFFNDDIEEVKLGVPKSGAPE